MNPIEHDKNKEPKTAEEKKKFEYEDIESNTIFCR